MDGLTVMEKVGQDRTIRKRPYFIVITAVGQEKITEDAFNKGANYYIMKPFNNQMLLERIKSVRNMARSSDRKCEDGHAETVSGENLETRVTNMLHEIGIPAHIKGYHYLRDAIIMAVNDMDVLNAITKILYPTVAKKYQTTSSVWSVPYGTPSRWHGAGGSWIRWMNCSAIRSAPGKGSRPIPSSSHSSRIRSSWSTGIKSD